MLVAIYTKGLGMGDVKLAAIIGYSAGFFKTSVVFIFACVIGLVFFLLVYFLKKQIKKIPFAPFVTVGYVTTELLCRRIL